MNLYTHKTNTTLTISYIVKKISKKSSKISKYIDGDLKVSFFEIKVRYVQIIEGLE